MWSIEPRQRPPVESAARPDPGRRLLRWTVAVAAFLLVAGGPALQHAAELRFPPPEFESGYSFPPAQNPAPRAAWLPWLDVIVLIAALGTASWLSLRRRSRRGVLLLSVFSLLYFGFYREGCVCSIGSVQNVALALGQPTYAIPLSVLLFFAAPLVTALLFGRSFCAGVCPHGALQDLVLLKPFHLPAWLEKGLGAIPFLYLGAGVLLAATGTTFLICHYDPFIPIFRLTGSLPLLTLGITFLLLGLFIGRPYCRFLCPYGALLKLASTVSKWRVRVTPTECTQCRLCAGACPFGVIREPGGNLSTPQALAAERRRLQRLLPAIPVALVVLAWAGWSLGPAAARLNPEVALAHTYVDRQAASTNNPLPKIEQLALSRAQQTADMLLPQAAATERQFRIGGALLGAWTALVVGFQWIGFSLGRRRSEWEPERGGCYSCARCFSYCPQERLRLGLEPLPAALPSPSPSRTAATPPPAPSPS